jgi:hypothetical protein
LCLSPEHRRKQIKQRISLSNMIRYQDKYQRKPKKGKNSIEDELKQNLQRK